MHPISRNTMLAKLRNAMTHDYDYLKPEQLESVRVTGYRDIEAFIKIAEDL